MSRFDKDTVKTLNRIAAQKILEKMRILRMSSTENFKRRWIWELLQNAHDKAAIDFPNEKVSVSIKFTRTSLEFSHNYSYFTDKNVEGIIRQISSDDKDWGEVDQTQIPKTIGRFGTGFLTTHLLSERVNVSALFQVEDRIFHKFTFPIDRSGRELTQLIDSINNSFQQADNKLNNSPKLGNPNFSLYNTSFKYELNQESISIAEIGLDDLENSLPYTLIFIDRIKSIRIERNDNIIIYEKESSSDLTDDIKLVEFVKSQNALSERLYFACILKNNTSIVIQISKNQNTNQISIHHFNSKIPKIFLGFPLIGTEEFNFPAVINNPFFQPTEPRDGIFITDKQDQSINNNKQIITEAIDSYFILLEYAINNDWQNLYLLANTSLPKEKEWVSINWYKNQVQRILRYQLLQSTIVYTDNLECQKIKLEKALFPYSKTKSKIFEIWNFAKALWSDKLPKQEHLEYWYEIIDNAWDRDLRLTLKQLVCCVADFSNVTKFAERIRQPEAETLNWLNKFIEFVLLEEQELLKDFAIIPNQHGEFRKTEQLWTDKNIPEELKDTLKILQEDWREKFKHNHINNCSLNITKTIDDIVEHINKYIKQNQHPKLQEAVLELISCYPNIQEHSSSNKLLEFAKDFYDSVPEKKILTKWTPSIWEESHNWFIHKLCSDIESKKNISNLTIHLKQDSLGWLSEITTFLNTSDLDSYFDNYAILPNQDDELLKKKNLFVDENIDEILKDILEELGYNYRSELLAIEIPLQIEGKTRNSKNVASEIIERVQNILKNEGIGSRQEKTKKLFEKLLLWFHENELLAKKIFDDLYEKRHRLRSDEEIIADIKFRQSLLNNENGYSEEEILQLINIPRKELNQFSKDELQKFEQWKQSQDESILKKDEDLVNPQQILIGFAIYSLEELERAKKEFEGTTIYKYLHHISTNSLEYFLYVRDLIERAKKNIKIYLSTKSDYNCDKWSEEDVTVIAGVKKNSIPIKIVVRPSDEGQVIIFYKSEFDALESPSTELWIDNNNQQEILTLGKVLKYTGINRIPLFN